MQTNTVQAVLATDGSRTYALFIYGDIQWIFGSVTVGFNAGDQRRHFSLPESSSDRGIFELERTSNCERRGTYIYRVDESQLTAETC
jgi:hypothetical protein